MTDNSPEDLFKQISPESEEEHANFEAYNTAVKSRLMEVLASPNVGGIRSVIETIMEDEDIGDKEDYVLSLLGIAYSKGRDDEHSFESGQIDNDDLRTIGNFRS